VDEGCVLVDSCVVVDEDVFFGEADIDEDLFFGEVDIDEEFADTGAEDISLEEIGAAETIDEGAVGFNMSCITGKKITA
jgi:hypothetical protein